MSRSISVLTTRAVTPAHTAAAKTEHTATQPARLVAIYLLGPFRIEVDGRALEPGTRTPVKSFDILRALAVAADRSCAIEDIHDWFWPDAEGDRAKAACHQALHRIRQLLGDSSLISQRAGRVYLDKTKVRVDLDAWELVLQGALYPLREQHASVSAMEHAFALFNGPLANSGSCLLWLQSTAERVRGKFIELASRLARLHESRGDHARARTVYLRALDMYPGCSRCYDALIRGRVAQHDLATAVEDYRRYERMLRVTTESRPPAAIQDLLQQAMSARRIDVLAGATESAFT